MSTHADIRAIGLTMAKRRREGHTYIEIAAEFGTSPEVAFHRVRRAAPELTGLPALSPNAKPKLEERKVFVPPPATGSPSGFIRPIPLSRLMSRRA